MKYFLLVLLFVSGLACSSTFKKNQDLNTDRPNILWLTIEDTSPYELGCYGNSNTKTPTIDLLAKKGIRYTNAWSTGSQCSPARSSLLTGCEATTYNMDFHRHKWKQPVDIPVYPKILQEAGYYCTNNSKTDYNILGNGKSYWDECGNKASYLSESRKSGQPFFAVFNTMQTHMSRLTSVTTKGRRDFSLAGLNPDSLSLPPHVPDLPEVRSDYAFHMEGVQDIDKWVNQHLDILEKEGYADNTIVFFFSDHGGCLPRGKGWAYLTGLQVPLVVYIPEKWQKKMDVSPGTVCKELVSFIDFAPTIFSLTSIDIPKKMQGKAFLGKQKAQPRKYQFGFTCNGFEFYRPARTVSDGRYKYVRYYAPHRADCLRNNFQWQMPSNLAWDNYVFYQNGSNPLWLQPYLMQKAERLYDIKKDPFELNDLSENLQHQLKLNELKKALKSHIREVKDLGLFPPMCRIKSNNSLYQWVRNSGYNLEDLYSAAEIASTATIADVPVLIDYLQSGNTELRYWGTIGFATLGVNNQKIKAPKELLYCLDDDNGEVVVAAAEALALLGEASIALPVLEKLIETKIDISNTNQFLNQTYNQKTLAYGALEMLSTFDKTKPLVKNFLMNNKALNKNDDSFFDIQVLKVNLGIESSKTLYLPNEEVNKIRRKGPLPMSNFNR